MKVLVLYEDESERSEALHIANSLRRSARTVRRGGEVRNWGGQILKVVQREFVQESRILTRVADCNEVLQGTSALATDIALGKWEGQ